MEAEAAHCIGCRSPFIIKGSRREHSFRGGIIDREKNVG
jgi:hypothetical protein